MGVRVRQKGGKWYVFINHHGQRKAKCVGDTKKAAVEVQRKLEAKLTLGDVGLLETTPSLLLFRDYAERWLTHYVPVACKPSSGRIFQSIVRNHLLPAFGAQALQSVTRSQIKDFAVMKRRHYTPKYVGNLLRTLHMIYAHAMDEEVLTHNPATRVGKYVPQKRVDPEQAIHPFTSAELTHYLATMCQHYPQHYTYFLCLARTGMREGEALGLRWDDLHFGRDPQDPHRFAHVQRTYDPAHRTFNTPKSGRSRRVDMSQELRAALLDLRQQRVAAAILHGVTAISTVVFCGPQGRPLAATWLSKIHRRVCTLAGLRVTRIHDLRHSYASIQLYERHAPIQYVSEQLGHASITITVDTYGHPRQGMSISLADGLDQYSDATHPDAPQTQPEHPRATKYDAISMI